MKGDKESNGLIENAVMLIRGIIRTIKCHIETSTQEPLNDESPILPWWVDTQQDASRPDVKKVVTGKTPFERLHGTKPSQEFVPFGEKVLAKQISTDPTSRMNSQIQVADLAWNEKQCMNVSFEECRRCGPREIRRLEPQSRWDKEATKNVHWSSMEIDRRQMDSGQTRNSSGPNSDPAIAI